MPQERGWPVLPGVGCFLYAPPGRGTLNTQSHLILTRFLEKQESLHSYEWGNRGPEEGSESPPHTARRQGKDPPGQAPSKACPNLRSTRPSCPLQRRKAPKATPASSMAFSALSTFLLLLGNQQSAPLAHPSALKLQFQHDLEREGRF